MMTIREKDFLRLTQHIRAYYGIDLSRKKTLIEGRLSNMLQRRGFAGFADYLDFLFAAAPEGEWVEVVNKLTTNYTFFMRERDHFEFLAGEILPRLQVTAKDKDLRIWSAGCSSGEEPYTLAMLLTDFLGKEKPLWDTTLLATDISLKALDAAQRGVYPPEALRDIPPAWKNAYFQKMAAGDYQVVGKIKKEVLFKQFNLNQSAFPFRKRFHVIFCRNVMIYFDESSKEELVARFYEMTEPGGYLFIGLSESLGRMRTPYRMVIPAIYRKG